MRWKAVIIDDELNNIENLSLLLQEYCPTVEVTGSAINAAKGKEIIVALLPDIVFLDIQMPEESGFDLLQSLDSIDFEVIFVTAFDKYGIQAVKFSAVDYLLKPVNIEELKKAVDKTAARLQVKRENEHIRNLLQYIKQPAPAGDHKLALPGARETRFVFVKDILYCKSDNAYTTFFLLNKEKIIVSKSIREYEELLYPYGIIRTHQSYLVNKHFVESFKKEDEGYLLLQDKTVIPISRLKKEFVKKELQL